MGDLGESTGPAPGRVASFWGQCIRIALRGSSQFANDWAWLVGVPALAGILAFIGKPKLFQEFEGIGSSVIVAALAFLITALVRFAVRILAVPVALYDESQAALRRARTELDARSARREAIAALAELREEGVQLRNEVITSEGFPEWDRRFSRWRLNALAAAERASPALKARLDVLDETRPAPEMPIVHSMHAQVLRIFSEILRRIGEFLEKEQHA